MLRLRTEVSGRMAVAYARHLKATSNVLENPQFQIRKRIAAPINPKMAIKIGTRI